MPSLLCFFTLGFKQETDVENKEAAVEDKTKQGIYEACVVAVIQLIGMFLYFTLLN